VAFQPPLDEALNVGVEQVVRRRVARAVHRKNAEGARGPKHAARRVALIDPQHDELRIDELVFRRQAGRVRGCARERNVPEYGGKAADSRLTPDRATSPGHTRGPQVGHRGMHRTRNPRRERVDHHGIEPRDRASLVVVSGGLKEMTGAGVRMRHRDHEAIYADAVGARRERSDTAVQQRRAEAEIGDDESQPIAATVGQDEDPRIQSQPVAACFAALGTVPCQPHSRRRRDVHAGKPGLQHRLCSGSGRRTERPRHVQMRGATAHEQNDRSVD